ncbi:MAG: hypothetical protein J7K83_02410 [Candidatus Aenigmarchaeota archaeon]|nr:hypothetical protein [Candidatus Aenigmarchaeota archaeon]
MKAQAGLFLVLVALIIGVVYMLNNQGTLDFSSITEKISFGSNSLTYKVGYPENVYSNDGFDFNLTLKNGFDFKVNAYAWLESGNVFSYNGKSVNKENTLKFRTLEPGENSTIVWNVKSSKVSDEIDAKIYLNVEYKPVYDYSENNYQFTITAVNNNSLKYYSLDKLGINYEQKKAPIDVIVSSYDPSDFIYKEGTNSDAKLYIAVANAGNGEIEFKDKPYNVLVKIFGNDISRLKCENAVKVTSNGIQMLQIPLNVTNSQQVIPCNYTLTGITDLKVSNYKMIVEYTYLESSDINIHVSSETKPEETNRGESTITKEPPAKPI